jgi:hypothetical protein
MAGQLGIEISEAEDEALLMVNVQETIHAKVEETCGFSRSSSLLGALDEGLATTGMLYVIKQRLAELGDTNSVRTSALEAMARQQVEVLGQIAARGNYSENKHYLDGVRIVTGIAEEAGGAVGLEQVLHTLDTSRMATIKQGTEEYERLATNPLLFISELSSEN